MFTDVSGLIAPNPPGLHYGVAALDIDGDGRTEFFVAGFGYPNCVLKWVHGALRDVTPPDLADLDRQAVGVAAGDLDGDGREEIYVLNTDTFTGPKHYADRLFDPRPDGGWDDLFSRPGNKGLRNLAAGRSVAAIDRRGTGRYGFVAASYGRPMRLYELSPDGRLADVAPGLGMDRTTGGRGLWVGPLVSERSDLFCVNEHGPNFLFKNRGDGTFDESAAEYRLADPDEHGRGVAALDADGDGRLDLAWGNWDGPNRMMVRQVDGTFRDRATPAMALPGAVRTVIAADFDNDGFEELFFNALGEPNRLFRVRDGSWLLTDAGVAAEPDGLGTGAAVADIDGDGRLELLVAHGESTVQPLSLFKGPDTGHGWLRVRPLTRFGAPARGARVRLTAGGRTQLRVIDGGSGYLCQMEPVAHFGLGAVEEVEEVVVTWPDGAREVVRGPAVRAEIVVAYPGG
ncbi:MAG TPA: CRTAC1 family protein [Fimbriiglobus sp.]|nr:CRTAC1 family protein [Fimbriiglobus sp.]